MGTQYFALAIAEAFVLSEQWHFKRFVQCERTEALENSVEHFLYQNQALTPGSEEWKENFSVMMLTIGLRAFIEQ